MIKNGKQHVASLRDGRQVFINGAVAGDVTEHNAFRSAVQSIAGLYDFQSEPQNKELMTYTTDTKQVAHKMWQMATSYAELVERRKALEAWAELSGGFLGRSPEHPPAYHRSNASLRSLIASSTPGARECTSLHCQLSSGVTNSIPDSP